MAPVRTSTNMILSWFHPETTVRPSGDHTSPVKSPGDAASCRSCPERTSYTRSSPPEGCVPKKRFAGTVKSVNASRLPPGCHASWLANEPPSPTVVERPWGSTTTSAVRPCALSRPSVTNTARPGPPHASEAARGSWIPMAPSSRTSWSLTSNRGRTRPPTGDSHTSRSCCFPTATKR